MEGFDMGFYCKQPIWYCILHGVPEKTNGRGHKDLTVKDYMEVLSVTPGS